MGTIEKEWVSKMGLVGLFKMQWKTPCYELLIEFLKEQGGK